MSETVDVVARLGQAAEALLEVALAVESLPDQGFPARDVAVGLDPPSTDEMPAALFHAAADLGEHQWIGALDPFVVACRAGGVGEILELRHPVERGAEGGSDLVKALPAGPQPGHVQVRVADHVRPAGGGGGRVRAGSADAVTRGDRDAAVATDSGR